MIGAGGSIQQQNAERDALNAQLAALPHAAVDQQESDTNAALASEKNLRVTALSTALSTRVAWDRVLSQISQVLPEDVWLTSLTSAAGETADSSTTTGAVGPPGASVTLVGSTYSQRGVARFLARLGVIPALSGRPSALEFERRPQAPRPRRVHDSSDRQGLPERPREAEALTPRALRGRDRRRARLRARVLVRHGEPQAGRGVGAQGRGCRVGDHGDGSPHRRDASEQRGHEADRGRGHLPAGEGDAVRSGHAGHPARARPHRRGDRRRVPVGHAARIRGRRRLPDRADHARLRRQLLRALRLPLPAADARRRPRGRASRRRQALLCRVDLVRRVDEGIPGARSSLSVIAYVYGSDVPASAGAPAEPAAAPAADPNAATPAPAPAAAPTGAEASP